MPNTEANLWITYSWDTGYRVHAVWNSEVKALRAAVSSGYLSVARAKWGQDITDAIATAESGTEAKA